MRTINEIASWYKKYNKLSNEKLRVEMLSLYTIVAFKTQGLEIEHGKLKIDSVSIELGITNKDLDPIFNELETRILNTINRVYGYLKVSTLLYSLAFVEPTIEKITDYLYDEIKNDIDNHKNFDFNEYVILSNNNVFFVGNDTKLTDEELEHLNTYQALEQNQFTVFRNPDTGKLVIY